MDVLVKLLGILGNGSCCPWFCERLNNLSIHQTQLQKGLTTDGTTEEESGDAIPRTFYGRRTIQQSSNRAEILHSWWGIIYKCVGKKLAGLVEVKQELWRYKWSSLQPSSKGYDLSSSLLKKLAEKLVFFFSRMGISCATRMGRAHILTLTLLSYLSKVT